MRETSYGIIPLRRVNGNWQVLLIKHQAGHWGFPKGHPERGEEAFEAAKRELFEETRLSVRKILQQKPYCERYRFKRGGRPVDKTVEYFLAEVEGEVALQVEELEESKWVDLTVATQYITFPEAKRLFAEVLDSLGERGR